MLQVNNQKLGTFRPYYKDDLNVDFDAAEIRKCLSEIIEPVYEPLQSAYPVEITDDKNNVLSQDKVLDEIMKTFGDTMDAEAEKNVCSLWEQTSAQYKKGLSAAELFTMQSYGNPMINHKQYPLPTPTVMYLPSDLKTVCKEYIAKQNDDNLDKMNVVSAFCINQPCLMVNFLTKFTFDEFKTYLNGIVSNIIGMLDPDTIKKTQDFQNIKFKNIEGVILRKNDGDGAEPYSFARIITKALLEFSLINDGCTINAPYIDELLCPNNLLFLNIDSISKSTTNRLQMELNDVKDGLSSKYKPISLNSINKLSSVAANKRRMAATLQKHQALMNSAAADAKRGIFNFRKSKMQTQDLSKILIKIVKKETNIAASENYVEMLKSSFIKANRRDPDNYNLPGKLLTKEYKPDIHIYLDTSGSISEDNYKHAIITLIKMAKKMDVNLYFNSFSHKISQGVKLELKGRSTKEIYAAFQKIPKVTGGTDYAVVWNYIMKKRSRQKEISLIITDFEYYPPRTRVDYPSKLYYAPISISWHYWASITNNAEKFCQNMIRIDPQIRQKMLIK